jgi:hypothetical protein
VVAPLGRGEALLFPELLRRYGIGAAMVVALAKTGFENISVYDFDRMEEHNLPNQLLPMCVGDQDTVQRPVA